MAYVNELEYQRYHNGGLLEDAQRVDWMDAYREPWSFHPVEKDPKWKEKEFKLILDELRHQKKDNPTNILANIKDIDPEFSKTVDDNFWELI